MPGQGPGECGRRIAGRDACPTQKGGHPPQRGVSAVPWTRRAPCTVAKLSALRKAVIKFLLLFPSPSEIGPPGCPGLVRPPPAGGDGAVWVICPTSATRGQHRVQDVGGAWCYPSGCGAGTRGHTTRNRGLACRDHAWHRRSAYFARMVASSSSSSLRWMQRSITSLIGRMV